MAATLPPGTRLAGKYELEGVLGRGGMGAVYQATHVGIGRRVAIKVLHAALLDRDDMRRRFELEARAASVIEHPGIVDVFDVGETDDGDPFIVMEYLEGASMRTLSKQAGGLSPGEVVGVLLPVLDALGAAHAAGIVHRDVKPANVFVCARPRVVKLLDFGVSRFGGGGVTQVGETVGTPRYMAPEQVLGAANLGPEADLYSVGAVLFTLLAGRPPHQGTSDAAMLARVINEAAPPLASVTQGLSPALCALVDELLVKEAARRPREAMSVHARLDALGLDVDLKGVFARAGRHAQDAALTPTPSSSQQRVQAAVARSVEAPRARVPTDEVPTRTLSVGDPAATRVDGARSVRRDGESAAERTGPDGARRSRAASADAWPGELDSARRASSKSDRGAQAGGSDASRRDWSADASASSAASSKRNDARRDADALENDGGRRHSTHDAWNSDVDGLDRSSPDVTGTRTLPDGPDDDSTRADSATRPGTATRFDRPQSASTRWPFIAAAAFVLVVAAALTAWWRAPPARAPTDTTAASSLPPPSGPVEKPRAVDVTLEAEPSDARFTVDGVPLDCNPCRLEAAPGTTRAVTVSADGAVSQSLDVHFDAPHLERVALTLLPSGPVRTAPKAKPAAKGKKPFVVDEKNPYE